MPSEAFLELDSPYMTITDLQVIRRLVWSIGTTASKWWSLLDLSQPLHYCHSKASRAEEKQKRKRNFATDIDYRPRARAERKMIDSTAKLFNPTRMFGQTVNSAQILRGMSYSQCNYSTREITLPVDLARPQWIGNCKIIARQMVPRFSCGYQFYSSHETTSRNRQYKAEIVQFLTLLNTLCPCWRRKRDLRIPTANKRFGSLTSSR
jgi:hypothetical protein